MATVLEIVDTAVKIGIGALISGVSTYLLTNKKFTHDLKKAEYEDRKNTLKEVASRIEKSTTLTNEFFHLIIVNDFNCDCKEVSEASKNLIDAHNEAGHAETLANLIGFTELATAIYELDKELQQMHWLLAGKDRSLNIDATSDVTKKINNCQKSIKLHLSAAYKNLIA